MERQKGSGLIIVLAAVLVILLVYMSLFSKPQGGADVDVEGYDPNVPILKQEGGMIDQAEDAKGFLEGGGRLDVSD